jgi:predicted nuclease of predicted toxin-antitoxin system
MRVLLDENLPHSLRRLFEDSIEVITVGYKGWQGKTNGELLHMAANEFDVFITMDGSIPYQQNLETIQISIILLKAYSNRDEDLAPLIPQVNSILKTLKKGEVVSVGI